MRLTFLKSPNVLSVGVYVCDWSVCFHSLLQTVNASALQNAHSLSSSETKRPHLCVTLLITKRRRAFLITDPSEETWLLSFICWSSVSEAKTLNLILHNHGLMNEVDLQGSLFYVIPPLNQTITFIYKEASSLSSCQTITDMLSFCRNKVRWGTFLRCGGERPARTQQ